MHFFDVVDSHDSGTMGNTEGDGRSCPPDATLRRGVQDGADETFAAWAKQDWASEISEAGEVSQELVILCDGFSKTDAGVKEDGLFVDAGSGEVFQTAFKKREQVVDDIGVDRGVLHRSRLALHVHHHHRGTGVGCDFYHAWVAEPGHVVDDDGPSTDGLAGNAGFHRIDGHKTADRKCSDDLDDSFKFFGFGNGIRAGAGGFPTDVDEVRTLLEHSKTVCDGQRPVSKSSTIAETVRGRVQDAHDQRSIVGLNVIACQPKEADSRSSLND